MARQKKRKGDMSKEALYLGFGLASMAKDTFDDFVSFLVKEGKLITQDPTGFRRQVMRKGEKEYMKLEKTIASSLKKVSKKIQVTANKTLRNKGISQKKKR